VVTPAGFEPAIFWMRTRYPGPLDEGAILPFAPHHIKLSIAQLAKVLLVSCTIFLCGTPKQY
jgi:hypothetical protein